jgi:hypothetical protein
MDCTCIAAFAPNGISGFAPLPLPSVQLLQPPNSPRSMTGTTLMFDSEGILVEVESSSLLQPPNSPISDYASDLGLSGSKSEGSISLG